MKEHFSNAESLRICMDFDGVIHSYESPWKGTELIPDLPVSGAIQALYTYSYHLGTVYIYSARSALMTGIEAMKEYIDRYDIIYRKEKQPSQLPLLETLIFPLNKPAASVYIDDRGFRFCGKFPTVYELMVLSITWQYRSDDGIGANEDGVRNCLRCGRLIRVIALPLDDGSVVVEVTPKNYNASHQRLNASFEVHEC